MRPRLVAVLLGLAACPKAAPPGHEAAAPPAKVTCAAVVTATIADEVVLRGSVAPPPLAQAVVASIVPGRIARLLVEEGDVVAARDLIAVIEDPTLGASAATSSAEVEAARVELRAATTDRARDERLLAAGIDSQQDVDTARAREDAARANVRAAEARGNLARTQLGRSELRAPRAGTVLHVYKRTGELLDSTDTAIAELADLSILELRAQATGADLIGLVAGAAATVVIDAWPGATLAAQVVAVAPAVDPATSLGTVRLRLTLPAGGAPAVGLAGAATIPRRPRQALVVPAAALRRSIAGHDEVVVCAGDHAAVRAVELGVRRPDLVEVTTGLAAGDRVVVDHVLGLEDEAPIEPVK